MNKVEFSDSTAANAPKGATRATTIKTVERVFNVLTLIGSIMILVSLSYDIMFEQLYYLGPGFLQLQLVVCLIFMADFFVRLFASGHKWKFFGRYFILFLVSIPLLNIAQWFDIDLSRSWYIVFKSAPLVRGFYGMVIVIGWITRSRARDLLFSYLFVVFGLTYFCSLIFYSFERGVNPKVVHFGDALWWAWMNVTTVGAEIFAVTSIGKVLSVVLPGLGMMMFPIFTVYITDRFKRSRESGK